MAQKDKHKEKQITQKITIAELMVILLVLAVVITVCVSAIVNYVKEKRELAKGPLYELQQIFYEEGENAFGPKYMPEDGVLVYDTKTQHIALYQQDKLSIVGTSFSGDKVRIRVRTDEGVRLLATYTQDLYDDFLQIKNLSKTKLIYFFSQGWEEQIVLFRMNEIFGDTCFLVDGDLYAYTKQGKQKVTDASSFKKAIVSDRFTVEKLPLLKKLSAVEEISFFSLVDYELVDNVLYTKGKGVLCYALPFVKNIVCPTSTYGMEQGCLQNAKEISSLSIPYIQKSVSYLFNGPIPVSLKSITFTSSLFGDIRDVDLVGCEGISIIKNF